MTAARHTLAVGAVEKVTNSVGRSQWPELGVAQRRLIEEAVARDGRHGRGRWRVGEAEAQWNVAANRLWS
jgi:hypothetical protein